MRHAALSWGIGGLLMATAFCTGAQMPAVVEVPDKVAKPGRDQLLQRHGDLVKQRDALRARVDAHNQSCTRVTKESASDVACSQAQAQLNAAVAEYRAAVDAFNQVFLRFHA